MSTTTFLKTVLGDAGKYCLFAIATGERRLYQKFFDSIDGLASAAEQQCRNDCDVYFALATFDDEGARKAENAVEMRSFFLDLDCGEGKGFSTQPAAISALKAFCGKFSLPRPTIVDSGRGIHAYWPLTSAVPVAQWKIQAERFKSLCISYGLEIDKAVPADIARVLRVPGTLNFKGNPALNVRVVGELAVPVEFDDLVDMLDKHTVGAPKAALRANIYHNDPVMQAMLGNSTSRFKTIMEKTKDGKGCAQLAHCAVNQADLEEPLWRAALSIAHNCEDGEKAIHFLSRNHPDYDPRETVRKASLTKGPYHCASFESLNPDACKECPHRGKITSPIQLGRAIKRAEEQDNVVIDKQENSPLGALREFVIPQFPYPYFRGKNGGVYMEVEGADGDKSEVLIYQHDLYITKRIIDPDEGIGECVVFRLHLPHDGLREFTIPLSCVTSTDEFRKALSKNGVAVRDVGAIMGYSIRWIDTLARQKKADLSRKQFGWIDDDLTGFALGAQVIYGDRVENNPPSSRTAPHFKIFEPKGTLEGWKRNLEFFNKPGFEEYQYALGTGFGAVLSRMTAVNGSLFHFYSKESGFGKSTVLYLGASIWGDPETFTRDAKDTHNSVMHIAEIWKDLPIYIDEFTNVDGKTGSKLVYDITSGKQRDRLASSGNATRWRGDTWSTIFMTTANTSLMSIIASVKDAPKAEAQRIVELEAVNKLQSKKGGDVLARELKKHYGHAGPIFLQYVIQNKDDVVKLLESIQAKIDDAVGLTSQNRFWSAQAAMVVTGLYIAKHIGLLDFDIKALMRWVIRYLKNYKINEAQMVSKSTAMETVVEYYFENVNNFLRIKALGYDDGISNGLDHLVTPDANPRIHLLGRHETDTHVLYLLPKPFKRWCVDKQIDYQSILRDLRMGETKGKTVVKRLGAGTKLNLPPLSVFRLRMPAHWLKENEDAEDAVQANETQTAEAGVSQDAK